MERYNFNNQKAVQKNPPNNYLVWAILSTVLCCLPLGIVSIVKSSNVNTLWAQERYEEAYKASKAAKNFAIYSAVAALIVYTLYIVLIVFLGFSGVFSEQY